MTDIKIESKVGGGAATALEPHAPAIYGKPGARIVAIVELAATERTEPAPESEKTPSVKMRISSMEIPAKEQEGAIREAMRALYLQRTAYGTLEEDGQLELSKDTLRLTGGLLTEIEMARLRAGLLHWTTYARRATGTPGMTATEALHELQEVADGLAAVLDRAALDAS